ncbi:MAG: hypothetical protein KGP28_09500 [Bdellovibrionales bacterium]|nr:hypothetical protein [Bdellovibrionales bacterium]
MNKSYRFLAVLLSLSTAACSPKDTIKLKGVDLGTHQSQGRTFVDLEAIVLMGRLHFPNLEVPIYHPGSMQNLGSVLLQPLDDGSNRLFVSVDYEAATSLDPTLGSTLPNGRELPRALNLGSVKMVGIPILEASRIYVGGNLKANLAVGVALGVPALDSVTQSIPIPLNLFFSYPFSPEVSGVAGLYSSPLRGRNGVGVFAKKTFAPEGKSFSIAASGELPEDSKRMTTVSLIKLDRLLQRNATLKIK